jgi:hypothetical protein
VSATVGIVLADVDVVDRGRLQVAAERERGAAAEAVRQWRVDRAGGLAGVGTVPADEDLDDDGAEAFALVFELALPAGGPLEVVQQLAVMAAQASEVDA